MANMSQKISCFIKFSVIQDIIEGLSPEMHRKKYIEHIHLILGRLEPYCCHLYHLINDVPKIHKSTHF